MPHGLAEFLNFTAQGFEIIVRSAILAALFTFRLFAPTLLPPGFIAFWLFPATLFTPWLLASRLVLAVQRSAEPVGELIEMFGRLWQSGLTQVGDGLLDVL